MLRVHFTAADLARTRVSDGADPLWETVLSLHRLRERPTDPALTAWRRRAVEHGPGPLRDLLPLVPRRGYFPDFLTPPAAAAGVEAGLEALMSTPRARLRAELDLLASRNALPAWTVDLADGRPAALRRLARALRAYHHAALGPAWPLVGRGAAADRALRLHALCQGGAEAMLRTYGPGMRWRPPVLEVDYPLERELDLRGRGLLLVPSYFCRAPVALADAELPPVLVYPAHVYPAHDGRASRDRGSVARSVDPPATAGVGGPPGRDAYAQREARRLAPLLGHTRAAVLQALGGDCTTTELAQRAGVSLSTASEHAAVLREAGLVSSDRRRNRVHHTLTPLGAALLAAG